MSRVFLSHSSRSNRQAIAVKAWLVEHEPGLAEEIFLDLDPHTGIRPGERWKQALQQANARCEAVICLLSKHWEASHECKVEFRYAENLNKTIVCARLELMPDSGITSEWQRCDLFPGGGPTTEVDIGDGGEPVSLDTMGLQRLLDALRALGIGAEHFPWPPSSDPDRAPYRGWAPLDEADAAVFFGRDAQIVRGLDVLHGMRSTGVESLFVVLGPSGSGKSSFLRAGLLPRLRRDDRRFLPLPIVRPERAVLTGERGLARAIHELRTGLALREPMLGEIKNACHPEKVERLRGWLEEARQVARTRLLDMAAEQPAPTLVLPVDQAEELFNPDAGPEAPHFLKLLTSLVEHEAGVTPAMIVAVTIRADRYEPLQIAPQLAGVETELFDQLKPLPPAGYQDVITGPALRATAAGRPLSIDPVLVERLLADTAEGADALPLLALTLERLYRDFGDDSDLTVAEYESMGGMTHVVQTEVDKLLASDPAERQAQLDTLHDAFIPWLATINPGNDQPMRRLARWDDLPAASGPLIQAMVEKRLLVKDIRDGQAVVEVALESLLRQWRELAAWLRDEAQDLKEADGLERTADDWRASGRDPAWLLEGTRLTAAETLADKPGFRDRLDPTREFLHASRERETHAAMLQKRSRRLRSVLALTSVAATVASLLGVMAWAQRNEGIDQRDRADSRLREAIAIRLVLEGQQMLAGQRPGGELRATQQILAANRFGPESPLVRGALMDAAIAKRGALKVIETTQHPSAVAFSHGGQRVVTGTEDGTVRVWDVATSQAVGPSLTGHTGAVLSVAVSSDGKRIVSGGKDGARMWEVANGQPGGQPITGHTVLSVAFSPQGDRIAFGSDDGVRLWDAANGQTVGLPIPGHGVLSVAFSPDGQRVASGNADGTLQLWDAATAQQVGQPLTGYRGPVLSVAFSPDGKRIISGSEDEFLLVWDAATGQSIDQPLTGHIGAVPSAAFSQDGKSIVSGSDDKTVRVWDAATGQPIGQPLTGHTGGVNRVAFSHDMQGILSAGDSGAVWVWPGPAAWPDLLCAKLTTNVSYKQWRDWVSPDIDYIKVCPDLPVASD